MFSKNDCPFQWEYDHISFFQEKGLQLDDQIDLRDNFHRPISIDRGFTTIFASNSNRKKLPPTHLLAGDLQTWTLPAFIFLVKYIYGWCPPTKNKGKHNPGLVFLNFFYRKFSILILYGVNITKNFKLEYSWHIYAKLIF